MFLYLLLVSVIVAFFAENAHGFVYENVTGSQWADTTEDGSCQLPAGEYAVKHALTLGRRSPALGALTWTNGHCGQVIRVSCGGKTAEAVVAGACDSDACGVDLITPTWNLATGNKPAGKVRCKVQMSNTSPLNGNRPFCYHRPGSNGDPESLGYYASLGVFNVAGRIVERAVAAGVDGVFRFGTGYFDFHSHNGQPSLNNDTNVQFFFKDGTASAFKLGQCRDGGSTPHIWR